MFKKILPINNLTKTSKYLKQIVHKYNELDELYDKYFKYNDNFIDEILRNIHKSDLYDTIIDYIYPQLWQDDAVSVNIFMDYHNTMFENMSFGQNTNCKMMVLKKYCVHVGMSLDDLYKLYLSKNKIIVMNFIHNIILLPNNRCPLVNKRLNIITNRDAILDNLSSMDLWEFKKQVVVIDTNHKFNNFHYGHRIVEQQGIIDLNNNNKYVNVSLTRPRSFSENNEAPKHSMKKLRFKWGWYGRSNYRCYSFDGYSEKDKKFIKLKQRYLLKGCGDTWRSFYRFRMMLKKMFESGLIKKQSRLFDYQFQKKLSTYFD